MTQNQSRAVLEIIEAKIRKRGLSNLVLDIALFNSGQTSAQTIAVSGTMVVWPGQDDQGNMLGEEKRDPFSADAPSSIGAKTTDVVTYSGNPWLIGNLKGDVLHPPSGSGGYVGTEKSSHPELRFEGKLTYRDIFNRRHELPFVLRTYWVDPSGETRMDGAGRHWRASEYDKRGGG
jgi:hypothetical protein